MPRHRLGAEMIVNSGQIASSNNGFDPQLRARTKGAVGLRVRTRGAVGLRARTRKV